MRANTLVRVIFWFLWNSDSSADYKFHHQIIIIYVYNSPGDLTLLFKLYNFDQQVEWLGFGIQNAKESCAQKEKEKIGEKSPIFILSRFMS